MKKTIALLTVITSSCYSQDIVVEKHGRCSFVFHKEELHYQFNLATSLMELGGSPNPKKNIFKNLCKSNKKDKKYHIYQSSNGKELIAEKNGWKRIVVKNNSCKFNFKFANKNNHFKMDNGYYKACATKNKANKSNTGYSYKKSPTEYGYDFYVNCPNSKKTGTFLYRRNVKIEPFYVGSKTFKTLDEAMVFSCR